MEEQRGDGWEAAQGGEAAASWRGWKCLVACRHAGLARRRPEVEKEAEGRRDVPGLIWEWRLLGILIPSDQI